MDQATQLRNIIKNSNMPQRPLARIITVTSGKGGVGKSNVAINLAIQFKKMGKRVIILDADFGLANIEIMFGTVPKHNLCDLIYQGKNIEYYFMINISKTNGDEIDLKITLKENSLSSVGLTMIIENLSNKDLEYGNPYSIENYDYVYWKNVPTINDLYFTMPAFSLNKGESKELNINWEYGYGKLKGKYRIVKEFSYQENGDYISFNKYLEFEIK